MSTLYLEYKIVNNKPGLLGDVASLLGLFKINILTIASIEEKFRGMLIDFNRDEYRELVYEAFVAIPDLEINCLRCPELFDILALKHGKKISSRSRGQNTYSFTRADLDLLIDFLSEFLKSRENPLIGFKGSPRVGKTETAIAAVVHANKHWQLLSSTLLRKIARTRIDERVLNSNTVFIIDAVTTFHRAQSEHVNFIKNIAKRSIPRIIEHPGIFLQETDFKGEDFDLILELLDETRDKQDIDQYLHSYNSFDIG